MREIVHLQAGQCGNQIGAKVSDSLIHFQALFQAFSCCMCASLDKPTFQICSFFVPQIVMSSILNHNRY